MPERGLAISLPFLTSPTPDMESAEAQSDGSPMPHSQPGLLLVDDDPFMLDMQSRMLRGMG